MTLCGCGAYIGQAGLQVIKAEVMWEPSCELQTAVCCCYTEVGAIETQIKETKARRQRVSRPVVGDMSEMWDSLNYCVLLLHRGRCY